MIKKSLSFLATLFVIFGLLATAVPAAAASTNAVSRSIKGTIVALNTQKGIVTISPRVGVMVNVKIAKTSIIHRTGKVVRLAKLHVGDKAKLTYNPVTKLVHDLSAETGNYDIHGTVEAVDTTANTIVIASEEGGNSVTLKVDTTTLIQRNGAAAVLADLLVGDKVEAHYNSASMLASLIKTEVEDTEFGGTIAAVDTTAKTVTVTPADGSADVVLNVIESTVIKINDTVISLAGLHVGNSVEVEFDSTTLNASFIHVETGSPDGSHH